MHQKAPPAGSKPLRCSMWLLVKRIQLALGCFFDTADGFRLAALSTLTPDAWEEARLHNSTFPVHRGITSGARATPPTT